jgi:hypothetical protein
MYIKSFSQLTRIMEEAPTDPDFPSAIFTYKQYNSVDIIPPTTQQVLEQNGRGDLWNSGNGFFGIRYLESGSNITRVVNHYGGGQSVSKNLGLGDIENENLKVDSTLVFEFHYILEAGEEKNIRFSILDGATSIQSSETFNFKNSNSEPAYIAVNLVSCAFYTEKQQKTYKVIAEEMEDYFLEVSVGAAK